jgi:hypothetical protein
VRRLRYCQKCGESQIFTGELQACLSCKGAIFHANHPRTRVPDWKPRLSAFDIMFLRSLNITIGQETKA